MSWTQRDEEHAARMRARRTKPDPTANARYCREWYATHDGAQHKRTQRAAAVEDRILEGMWKKTRAKMARQKQLDRRREYLEETGRPRDAA